MVVFVPLPIVRGQSGGPLLATRRHGVGQTSPFTIYGMCHAMWRVPREMAYVMEHVVAI
jgi:hypothetical protein